MCGIIGVWNVEKAAEVVYHGLHALQHRGKESAGIAALTNDGRICSKRGEGIVNHVFNEQDLLKLEGRAAIGHVKQSHDIFESGVQPISVYTKNGEVALSHNGLLTNREALMRRLMAGGSVFTTDSDGEIILHKFSCANGKNIEDKIRETFDGINPAYSVVMLTHNELIGVRDAFGVRPLEIGLLDNHLGEGYVIASESAAFDRVGAQHIGQVQPGEMVIADRDGLKRRQLFDNSNSRPCILGHIYLGHPTSFQFGSRANNGKIRKEIGRQLYLEHPVEADVVSAIPDASNSLALGFNMESKIPFDFAIVRGHYIGRQFIDSERYNIGSRVLKKFSVDRDVVNGKRIVLVDDFILSGETLRDLTKKAREFGAREVHVRVAYPYKNACYLGVTTSGRRTLLADKMPSVEEMRKFLDADSLGFLSLERLKSIPEIRRQNYCMYCADGVEVVPRM